MGIKFGYQCHDCGKKYTITADRMLCTDCGQKQIVGQPMAGILEVTLAGTLAKNFSLFDLLPVAAAYFPAIPVGQTPLWQHEKVRKQLGVDFFAVKNEGSNPTGSLKDRASWLVSAFARQYNISRIALASTGNAGSSMAGIGASAEQKVQLFLPQHVPPAKMVQALQYGAEVYLVQGNYDRAFALSLEYTQSVTGVLNRNTGYNPMTIEGKKTVSIELYQSLGQVPDYVFVPTGDGVILAGVYKGFRDLMQLGITSKIPIIVAVQANRSNAIARAFSHGVFDYQSSQTVADSISVDVPSNGQLAVKLLKKYNGYCVTVSDEAILAAQRDLSSQMGLFVEPAGAAAYAGCQKIKEQLESNAKVVVLTTGNGLKDVASASKIINKPTHVINSIAEIGL